ncbi:retrovirus-related pol polyprotein from transposon TNT 1-94 [Tanacetum coccineum]
MAAKLTATSASECLFADFLSKIEPKKVYEALKHPRWVNEMQKELNQFYRNKVWTLVPLPYGKIDIDFKWVFMNKKHKLGTVIRNKARLVAQGFSQEEGIDYDKTFASVVRMEAIWIFLAFSTYMNFKDDKRISFCQEKYTRDLLKKYEISNNSSVKTPIVPQKNLGTDLAGKPVNETLYRGMISAHDLILKDTQTQTLLVAIWTEKAPHVPVNCLEENWFVGVQRNSSQWLCPLLRLSMMLLLGDVQNSLDEKLTQ